MSFDSAGFTGGGGLRFVGLDDFKFSNYFSFASKKHLINLPQKKIEKNRFLNLFRINVRIIQQKIEHIFEKNDYANIRDTFHTKIFY
jgi:hypothetical protein